MKATCPRCGTVYDNVEVIRANRDGEVHDMDYLKYVPDDYCLFLCRACLNDPKTKTKGLITFDKHGKIIYMYRYDSEHRHASGFIIGLEFI